MRSISARYLLTYLHKSLGIYLVTNLSWDDAVNREAESACKAVCYYVYEMKM